MKPNINLKHPTIKSGVSILTDQMRMVLQNTSRFENAVCSILWTLKITMKDNPVPEQIGSGVVVEIQNEYFIFTASHVFDDIGDFQLLIGLQGSKKLLSLEGDRFSTAKGKSGTHSDDPIDASVYHHIKENIPQAIKNIALSLDDLDFNQSNIENCIYVAIGFRSKKSNTSKNTVRTRQECFPSIEYAQKEYNILNIDSNLHLAIAYEDQVLMNGNWQLSPQPKGFSRGAIVKGSNVSLTPQTTLSLDFEPKLSAITIAHRREKNGNPGVLIGTRLGIHLGLIDKYLPELLNENQR